MTDHGTHRLATAVILSAVQDATGAKGNRPGVKAAEPRHRESALRFLDSDDLEM